MKLSIVVSTYNRTDTFLPKCLDSIVFQSFKDFELIVVEDGWTKECEKKVREYQLKDKRVMYISVEHFGNDTRPKNEGARLASGEYLMFVDDDNELRPDALQCLTRALDDNSDIDMVYGDMWLVERREKGISHDFDRQFLILRNYIDTSEAMMRKKAFDYVEGFDETLKKFVDWNLWVRMAKAGFNFKHIDKMTLDYHIHEETKSQRVRTEMYMHPKLGQLWVPTFDPTGCYIRNTDWFPKVAIYTIHYDRLEYSQVTHKEMTESAGYSFDWFVADNGSKDGTKKWLETEETQTYINYETNRGITKASNDLIGEILKGKYDIIVKVDNDVEFVTKNWLADIVELWKRNHMLYISPYVEGLVHNPGGADRVGYGMIGNEMVEVTQHIGGICAAISAKAYKNFHWEDNVLHGNQDLEASQAFAKQGYMPCYYPKHIICHRDTTVGQWDKYKTYFDRRVKEKTTLA